MKNKKTLIIGFGEIGKALYNVLSLAGYELYHRDIDSDLKLDRVDVMHICFPYTKNFIKSVVKYQKLYNPKYTVIHSTVKIGTSEKCNAYYSPVRGIHPVLDTSLTTFVKYLAPRSNYLKSYFTKAGMETKQHDDTKSLEAMKLYCTTVYGLNIIAEKEIYAFCKKHNLDYDMVYTDSTKTYNTGYELLGRPEYSKYELKHFEGKIGGHCVIPNCGLLNTEMAKFILKQNKKL